MSAPISPAFGIAGWKNSGKTTLAIKLIAELTRRGYRVASVKHAHHDADVDHERTDSFRHRQAGSVEVALVTSRRWAIMHELDGAAEPSLTEMLRRLSPSDIVIVEGYKREPIPKIEVRRLQAAQKEPLAADDPNIIAVVSDHETDGAGRPTFQLNDIAGIADFLVARMRVSSRGVRKP